jgi:hypothetical protein
VILKTADLPISIVGRATLKMLRRKSKTRFVKQERNTQNALALLLCKAHCTTTINAKNARFPQKFLSATILNK